MEQTEIIETHCPIHVARPLQLRRPQANFLALQTLALALLIAAHYIYASKNNIITFINQAYDPEYLSKQWRIAL